MYFIDRVTIDSILYQQTRHVFAWGMWNISKWMVHTCLMSAILVYTMSISKALVHVKPTQCPHIALHASLASLHRQAEFSLQPDWQSQYINFSSPSGETAQSESIGSKLTALISHPNSRGSLLLPYQDWTCRNTRKECILAEPLVGGRVLSLVVYESLGSDHLLGTDVSRHIKSFELLHIVHHHPQLLSGFSNAHFITLFIVAYGKMRTKLYTAFCEHEGFLFALSKWSTSGFTDIRTHVCLHLLYVDELSWLAWLWLNKNDLPSCQPCQQYD